MVKACLGFAAMVFAHAVAIEGLFRMFQEALAPGNFDIFTWNGITIVALVVALLCFWTEKVARGRTEQPEKMEHDDCLEVEFKDGCRALVEMRDGRLTVRNASAWRMGKD